MQLNVLVKIANNQHSSCRNNTLEYDISYTSVLKNFKLKICHPYKVTLVHELVGDFDQGQISVNNEWKFTRGPVSAAYSVFGWSNRIVDIGKQETHTQHMTGQELLLIEFKVFFGCNMWRYFERVFLGIWIGKSPIEGPARWPD